MDTNELKALAKMLTYASDTLSAMLESDAEPAEATVKPEPPTVDWSKPIQTRGGLKVELNPRINIKDIVAITVFECGQAVNIFVSLNGEFAEDGEPHEFDIINVPEPPPLDLTKPVQTRDGRRVRILCTDRKSGTDYSVVGLLLDEGIERARMWQPTGHYSDYDNITDLVNVPAEQL